MNEWRRWRQIPWSERKWVIYDLVRKLQPNATGFTLYQAVYNQYGKDLTLGWLYTVLERFEREGFVTSERRASREGRRTRFYFATGKPRPQPKQKASSFGTNDAILRPAFILASGALVQDRGQHSPSSAP